MIVKEDIKGDLLLYAEDDVTNRNVQDIRVFTPKKWIDFTSSGFPYVILTDSPKIYIPKDTRVWFPHAVKGSISKGEKSVTIKKGSENMVYIMNIKYKCKTVQNPKVTVNGKVISEIIYDHQDEYGFFEYIQRVIEVTPDSTIKVELDVKDAGKVCLEYTKGDMKLIQAYENE